MQITELYYTLSLSISAYSGLISMKMRFRRDKIHTKYDAVDTYYGIRDTAGAPGSTLLELPAYGIRTSRGAPDNK
jgi:hypothetical protein